MCPWWVCRGRGAASLASTCRPTFVDKSRLFTGRLPTAQPPQPTLLSSARSRSALPPRAPPSPPPATLRSMSCATPTSDLRELSDEYDTWCKHGKCNDVGKCSKYGKWFK